GVPVIAAVHGYCLGGAFWYSMACDITIAAEDAVFGQPEIRHISNTSFLLAALTNWKQAHRWALTGDHMGVEEAYRLGIVNKVVPREKLEEEAWALAERISKVPEASVRINKAVTWMGLQSMGLSSAMYMNSVLSALAHCSHGTDRERLWEAQAQGGLKAFLEARDGPFWPEPYGPKSAKK
ncbi:MAG: enoyl-CoA hydratase/isomerase family protein, partial [Dehalococcoidia bacterium]